MARRNTPNPILRRRGSTRARDDESQPESGEVFPTFPLSEEGSRAWRRICTEMDNLGILSPTYADCITIAAGAIGNIEIANRDLIERGHISVTERGETKNPSFTILTSSQTTAHKYLALLGMTPTTIGKIIGTPKEDENEFAGL